MSSVEVLQNIILPIAGAVGGISGVITFVLAKKQRDAQVRLLDIQGNEVATVTPAKLQQLIMESAEKALSFQNELIDDLRNKLNSEIGSREETIKDLKKDLAKYQEENARLMEDNQRLDQKVTRQDEEIVRLNQRIKEQDQEIQKLKDQIKEMMERKDG